MAEESIYGNNGATPPPLPVQGGTQEPDNAAMDGDGHCVISRQEADSAAALMEVPPIPDVTSLARSVHEEFCRRFCRLGYAVFEKEWMAAARLAIELGAPVDEFVEAQKLRRSELEPEDLASLSAAIVYRRYRADTDNEILQNFIYSDDYRRRWLQGDATNTIEEFLLHPMLPVSCTYRVAGVLRFCPDDAELVSRILDICGGDAVKDFEASPLLMLYLKEKWNVDPSAVIERVRARRVEKLGDGPSGTKDGGAA